MYNIHTQKSTYAIWSSVSLLQSQLTSLQQTDGGRGDLQDVLLASQVGHAQGARGRGEATVVQLIDLLARLQNLQEGRNCPRWVDKSCVAVRWWVSRLTSPWLHGWPQEEVLCCVVFVVSVCVCVCVCACVCELWEHVECICACEWCVCMFYTCIVSVCVWHHIPMSAKFLRNNNHRYLERLPAQALSTYTFFKCTYFQDSTNTTCTYACTHKIIYIRAMWLKKTFVKREMDA